MGLTLQLSNLASRVVRSRIATNGLRTFNPIGTTSQQSQTGGIISKLFDAAAKFGGFLLKGAFDLAKRFISFSWSTLWGALVQSYLFLYNFNWNISDEDLDQQIKSSYNALAGSLGGTLGNAVGWLACGILPGAVMFSFNEALGLYVLKNVGQEALEELIANVSNLTRLTFSTVTKSIFAYFFKKIRARFFGKPGKEPWSFAIEVDRRVESISNEQIRSFVSQFLEEAGEACIEAGYVVANSVESYMAMQKMANASILGTNQTVEITLNRNTTPQTP